MIGSIEPKTLTIPEAARVLGIGKTSAYRLAAEGRLPGAIHLGGRIIVSREAIEEFLRPSTKEKDKADATGHALTDTR